MVIDQDQCKSIYDLALRLGRAAIEGRAIILTDPVSPRSGIEQCFLSAGAKSVGYISTHIARSECVASFFRDLAQFYSNPPSWYSKQMACLDPIGEAKIYAGSVLGMDHICQRPLLGARRRAWIRAETKRNQVCLTEGQPGLAQEFIDLSSLVSIEEVSTLFPQGRYVISGDPHDYLAMGASHVYLTKPESTSNPISRMTLLHGLARECSGIRVSAFCPGLPATYYGFVARQSIAIMGPFETLVFVNRSSLRLSVDGIMSPVRISSEFEESGIDLVSRLALRLSEQFGYVGAFCVDGVFTESGYVALEINPRICAGFSLLGEIMQVPSLFSFCDIVVRENADVAESGELVSLLGQLHVDTSERGDLRLWARGSLEQELLEELATCRNDGALLAWQSAVRTKLASEDRQSLCELC